MSEHVGQAIKNLRDERDLSKARLARDAGISDAYLVQIEKGQRTPSASVLVALAKALRIPPHRLLIPSGYYTDLEISRAEARLGDDVEFYKKQHGRRLTDPEKERLLARHFEEVERERAMEEWAADPAARERDDREMRRDIDPLSMSDDEFWDWDVRSSWAPEHWDDLTDRDRRLVQNLINRLILLAPQQ